MKKTYIATQIRNNKVVQSIIVRKSDFEDLKVMARCSPKSVWSIESRDRQGIVLEVLK